jgi:hypothetical protein
MAKVNFSKTTTYDAYNNSYDNASTEETTYDAQFFLACFSKAALIVGPVVCLLAAVAQAPVAFAVGLGLTALGGMTHFYNKGFNGFFSADKTASETDYDGLASAAATSSGGSGGGL